MARRVEGKSSNQNTWTSRYQLNEGVGTVDVLEEGRGSTVVLLPAFGSAVTQCRIAASSKHASFDRGINRNWLMLREYTTSISTIASTIATYLVLMARTDHSLPRFLHRKSEPELYSMTSKPVTSDGRRKNGHTQAPVRTRPTRLQYPTKIIPKFVLPFIHPRASRYTNN
jgi:hypothetical protein